MQPTSTRFVSTIVFAALVSIAAWPAGAAASEPFLLAKTRQSTTLRPTIQFSAVTHMSIEAGSTRGILNGACAYPRVGCTPIPIEEIAAGRTFDFDASDPHFARVADDLTNGVNDYFVRICQIFGPGFGQYANLTSQSSEFSQFGGRDLLGYEVRFLRLRIATWNLQFSTPSFFQLGIQWDWEIYGFPVIPIASVSSVSANEGKRGFTEFEFVVSLSDTTHRDVTVDYQTVDGTASAADGDYIPIQGTLTIPAGVESRSLVVMVRGDRDEEADETFDLVLSNPIDATLGDPGRGTILDDDTPPALSVSDAFLKEGQFGQAAMTFTISTTRPTKQQAKLSYETADESAHRGDGDYERTAGKLKFPKGETEMTVSVPINGDLLNEPDESFLLVISKPKHATIADASGRGWILNDDNAVAPSVEVLFPNTRRVFLVGSTQTLLWTATDDVGVVSTTVQLSRDNGATYETIATLPGSGGGFVWEVPPPATGEGPPVYTGLIKVIAIDDAGNTSEDVNDEPFAIYQIGDGAAVVADDLAEQGETIERAPAITALSAIAPNPARGTALIHFSLATDAVVRLLVLDLQGRRVATLASGVHPAGRHQVQWGSRDGRAAVAPGVYFVRFSAGDHTSIKRLLVLN